MKVQFMAEQATSPHTVETDIEESQGLGVIWLHIKTVYQRKKNQTIGSILDFTSFRN